MQTKSYEKKSDIPDHLLHIAFEDGVAAAEQAYREDDTPRMGNYKEGYAYPSTLNRPKNSEERTAMLEQTDLWFSWLRGWNSTSEHILVTRHNTESGFGPAFMSPKLGVPYEEYAGERVTIETMHGGFGGDMARVRHTDGKSFLHHRSQVLPDRRREVIELFSNTDQLIEAAETTITEMRRILKTLKGTK